MELSVSNIAWNKSKNRKALEILNMKNIKYIDVAPTLISDSIDDINISDVENYYKSFDIKIVGMQSLLYPFPDISLFDNEYSKNLLLNYLEKIFIIANKLKIENMVFGSPKNRIIRDNISISESYQIEIFREISKLAKKNDCIICFEPNPSEYGCNFMTKTYDTIDFIKKVNDDNFKLNLDISTTIMNGEDVNYILKNNLNIIQHLHISSPFIKGILDLDNESISNLLRKYKYKKFITMECLFPDDDDELSIFLKNIDCFVKNYK
jgi:sugar phosphate isomerase/epimerase